MFKRLIDVFATNINTGETYVLVDHNDGINSLVCKGDFERFCGTEVDKMNLYIYNLPANIIGNISSEYENYKIRVSFSYEDENPMSVIFEGNLMRITNQREDSVTSKTTLYVYDSGQFSTYGFYSGSYSDGVNYYDIAKDICENNTHKISYSLDEKLKQYTVYGSLVYYNSANECLQDIADKTDTLLTFENDMAIISSKEGESEEEIIVFTQYNEALRKTTSNSGLIGIPTLESDGLSFSCLLNPLMSIYKLVLIDNSIISVNQTGVIPNRNWGAQLDSNNLYRVIRFSGTFANNGDECRMDVKALSREIFDEF